MSRKKKTKMKLMPIITLFIIILGICIIGYKKIEYDKKINIMNNDKKLVNEIKSHYNKYVITNKESNIYNSDGDVIGKINNGIELSLDEITIDKETKYFKILDIENSYIKYEDVTKIEELSNIDDRYKKYIPFNKNIKTKNKTIFYDENNNYIYEVNNSYDFPIIILDDNRYGIEFNNRLLYISKEDIENEYNNHNTDLSNTKGVPVFNYHAFYDEENATEKKECNTSICHSKKQFRTHLDYFRDNNIMTLKVKEFDLYIENKIQLPKSVLLTIDDGGRTGHAFSMLEEYKMYAAIFLITAWFPPKDYPKSEFIELHSHGHNLHNGGDCPGGQGGAIKCLAKDKLQEDLKTSRELLNNTNYFCYPFYEYNQYSIDNLKEAGFTMAFVGEEGDMIAHPGVNRFRVPRFAIMTHTTMNDIKDLFRKV